MKKKKDPTLDAILTTGATQSVNGVCFRKRNIYKVRGKSIESQGSRFEAFEGECANVPLLGSIVA